MFLYIFFIVFYKGCLVLFLFFFFQIWVILFKEIPLGDSQIIFFLGFGFTFCLGV